MAAQGESGVSPLIGTILVLGISIAGVTVALLMGAPTLQRIQEQAALDGMVAQLGTVRESAQAMSTLGDGRTVGITMPSGTLRLEPGTSWMVTFGNDTANPDCDFQVAGWSDGDAEVHIVRDTGCRELVGNPQLDCALANLGLPLASLACIEVARLNGANETPIAPAGGFPSGTSFRLTENIDPVLEYVFRLTDRDGTTYAEAWLLRTDRLHWAGGPVGAELEAGAILAHGRAGDQALAGPRIDGQAGSPSLVVLPSLRIDRGGEVSGTGTRSLDLELTGAHVRRGLEQTSYRTRIDLVGDNAALLCRTFLASNDDGAPPWQADGPDGACATAGTLDTTPALEDDAVSVRIAPGLDAIVFTQMVYDVRLLP